MLKLQFTDNPQRSLWLVGETIKLGSDLHNDVVLSGLGIEAFHAQIHIDDDELWLKHCVGPCFINDCPVDTDCLLKVGDQLRLGQQRLDIIDPKVQLENAATTVPGSAGLEDFDRLLAHSWQLIAEHPQLKQQDFSIAESAVIGRAKDCDLSVPYKLLSREHARLWQQQGELFVEDLHSANGCFVNGERISGSVQLRDGDRLSLAKLHFTIAAPPQLSLEPAAADHAASTNVSVTTQAEDDLLKTMLRPAITLEHADAVVQSVSDPSVAHESEVHASLDVKKPAAKRRWPLWLSFTALLIVIGAGLSTQLPR